MKVLLAAVNAKYIHSNLAVYSLKAYAEAKLCSQEDCSQTDSLQAEIELCEYTINQDREKVLADIYRKRPEWIAFSCYIWNISYIKELCMQLRLLLPKMDIWLGGPEVSFEPQKLLKALPVKGIMLGEGEAVFTELISCYQKYEQGSAPFEEALHGISGIACLGYQTEPQAILSMDELPFVYERLPREQFENRIIYYETSRGCPYRCSYCLSSIDKSVRFRSPSIVKGELQFFLDRAVEQVKFVDRTFNCSKEHAMELWTYILEHDNGITNFHFEIAADIMTEDELAVIKRMRPGLIQLEIGVQTTNQDTIEAIKRKMDFERVGAVVKKLQEGKNVHLHLDLIAGLPKEDFISFQKSFDDVYGLHPQQLQLGFLKVLKGTAIAAEAEKEEIKYWTSPPYEVLATKQLRFDEILELKKVEEMVELYYNSGQFHYTIQFLEKYFPSFFSLYQQLAEYYEQSGYGILQPSRVRKYEILLEFAMTQRAVPVEACKEYLTLDLYLREKLKKRPDFSSSQEMYKEKMQDFFKREERNSVYLPEYKELDYRQLQRLTHIEVFDEIYEKRTVLLFCYERRDVLTGDAKWFDITDEFEGSI